MNIKERFEKLAASRPDLIVGRDAGTITETDLGNLERMAADVSLDQIRDMIWSALNERNKEYYLREVYPSYLIYEDNLTAKFYRLAWSIMDGALQLGNDPDEVERTWVETRATESESDEGVEMTMRILAAQDPEGSAWDVTICEPGFTKNGWYVPEDALRIAADENLFEGVDVNLYEMPQGATHVPAPLFDIKSLLVKNKVGYINQAKHAAGVGLKGVLHFLDSAKWLGKNLLAAQQNGQAVYGLSFDCPVRASKTVIDGKNVFKIDKFRSADSVDIVTRPAAGGKFNRAVASMPAQKTEDFMDKAALLKMIQEKRSDLLKGKVIDTLTDQEVEALARMAMEPPAQPDGAGNAATKDDLAVMRCEMALKEKLAESDIPPVAKERIKKTFTGRIFTDDELTRAIADEKDYLAKITPDAPEGGAAFIAGSTITGGLSSLERACMAADRLFGLTKQDVLDMAALKRLDNKPFFEEVRSVQDMNDYDSVPAFTSIREMYTYFTGDSEVSGRFIRKNLSADLRGKMDITSGTFSYVLGNTLGRRLVSIYRAIKYLEELLVSIKKPVKDFRTQEAVLVGGFPNLSTVDPESGDYQEIAGVTDEESTYTIGQKGNLLTITRRTIINDDISIITRLIDGLARVARRTHAEYVWDFWVSNATCSDGTAWFTSGHGNLGSTAMSHAQALIAYKAIGKMTEKDSGKRLGLLADPDVKINLIGPIDVMDAMGKIEKEEYYYTSNDLTTKVPNPLYGRVKAWVIPSLTDTDDWGMLLPPNVIDIVEMGYLNGRQDPELFVADSPQAEQVFVADKIRHKIRHEYAGAVIDYRSGYKQEV